MTDAKSLEQLGVKQIGALVAAIIRSLNQRALLAWDRSDYNDESAGFSADLDLAISVQREENGFTATIVFAPDALPMFEHTADGGADVYMPEEITIPIDANLYTEIEQAFRQRARETLADWSQMSAQTIVTSTCNRPDLSDKKP